MEDIDGRAESSFNPRDVYFPDYDANQLRQILENRRDAFRSDALTDDDATARFSIRGPKPWRRTKGNRLIPRCR